MKTKPFVCSTVHVILAPQTCGRRSSKAAESKHQAIGTYFSERICYMFLISKCRGEYDLGLFPLLFFLFIYPCTHLRTHMHTHTHAHTHTPAINSLRCGWVFLERTRILSGIQFTTHFIDFVVVKTKRFVGSTVNVILTRQTCGQRSSRAAESKRRTLGNYFYEIIFPSIFAICSEFQNVEETEM